MNLSIVENNNGNLLTTSEVIAGYTDNQHKNVLSLIEMHLASLEEFGKVAFETRDGYRGSSVSIALLTEEQSTFLISCMRNNPKVIKFKIGLVKEFSRMKEALNNAPQIPQTLPEALRMAADLAEHNAKLLKKAEEDAPKVQFVNDFVEHGDSKTFTEIAAILGVKLKFLMDTLRIKKIVYKAGGDWKAYADYDKHFETKVGVNNWADKVTGEPMSKDYSQLRVTTGGLVWLKKRLGVNAPALKAVK